MKLYRQGDILIKEVLEIPADSLKRKTRVILEGEITGHKHQLTTGSVLDSGRGIFLDLPMGSNLEHEEHDTIELPEGKYQVIRQREYDENEIRRVED